MKKVKRNQHSAIVIFAVLCAVAFAVTLRYDLRPRQLQELIPMEEETCVSIIKPGGGYGDWFPVEDGNLSERLRLLWAAPTKYEAQIFCEGDIMLHYNNDRCLVLTDEHAYLLPQKHKGRYYQITDEDALPALRTALQAQWEKLP